MSRLEAEISTLRAELQQSRDRCQLAEQDAYVLRKLKEKHGEPEELAAALKVSEEQNKQIRDNLKNETKVKMDLFSELGALKRELGNRMGEFVVRCRFLFLLKQSKRSS